MMRSESNRVFRPLGLSLAIAAGSILFGLWPLVKFYVAWRWNRGFEEDGAILGALIPFDWITILTGFLGVCVLISAVWAWLGKPPQARFVFQGLILITTLVLIGETYFRVTSPDETYNAIYPLEQSLSSALQCQVPLQILLTLYIMWYCNRAPARAFYLQKPLQPWHDEPKS